MTPYQPGILCEVPSQASYLTFSLRPGMQLKQVVDCLQKIELENVVVGLGSGLLESFHLHLAGHKPMPVFASKTRSLAMAQDDLWCWLRAEDSGDILHLSRNILKRLSPCFQLQSSTPAFRYRQGRDLTGYEDGTENPVDEEAVATAFIIDTDSGLNGSSFVAVQKWQHDLDGFEAFPSQARDNIFGRRLLDNVEFESAPESAHVKRAAQESFSPEAFMLRRSMPWVKDLEAGLIFVSFAVSFYPFESVINRMIGNEDGIEDGLFQFSQVLSGAYYWCPPNRDGFLNLEFLTN